MSNDQKMAMGCRGGAPYRGGADPTDVGVLLPFVALSGK